MNTKSFIQCLVAFVCVVSCGKNAQDKNKDNCNLPQKPEHLKI